MSFLTMSGLAGLGAMSPESAAAEWESKAFPIYRAIEFKIEPRTSEQLEALLLDLKGAIRNRDKPGAQTIAFNKIGPLISQAKAQNVGNSDLQIALGELQYQVNLAVNRYLEEIEPTDWRGGTAILSFDDEPTEARMTSRVINTTQLNAVNSMSVQEQVRQIRLQQQQAATSRQRVANEPRPAPSTPGLSEVQQVLLLMQANQEAQQKEQGMDLGRVVLIAGGTIAGLAVIGGLFSALSRKR